MNKQSNICDFKEEEVEHSRILKKARTTVATETTEWNIGIPLRFLVKCIFLSCICIHFIKKSDAHSFTKCPFFNNMDSFHFLCFNVVIKWKDYCVACLLRVPILKRNETEIWDVSIVDINLQQALNTCVCNCDLVLYTHTANNKAFIYSYARPCQTVYRQVSRNK